MFKLKEINDAINKLFIEMDFLYENTIDMFSSEEDADKFTDKIEKVENMLTSLWEKINKE